MDDIREALEIINAEKYDQGFDVKALAERISRIRAEARAEALGGAEKRGRAWFMGEYGEMTQDGLALAILADEPKEERGAEGPCCKCVEEKGAPPCEFCGPPAWEAFQERESSWEPMVRALIGLLPRRERRWLKGVVDAEVERRIEEAGR